MTTDTLPNRLTEYSVYEITTEGIELTEQPSRSPHCNFIGTVEAEDLEHAQSVAQEEYGAPVAVE